MNPPDQTEAAHAARRRQTQAKLERVRQALTDLRREKTPATVTMIAQAAQVSRTFLYQNAQAKALISEAVTEFINRRAPAREGQRATSPQAGWKERALNAEDALQAAEHEIRIQRIRIGELLGKIRDLEHDLPEGSIQRIITENTSLKTQVHQLTTDQKRLQQRLTSARDNNRFLDKRTADLEAQLAEFLPRSQP